MNLQINHERQHKALFNLRELSQKPWNDLENNLFQNLDLDDSRVDQFIKNGGGNSPKSKGSAKNNSPKRSLNNSPKNSINLSPKGSQIRSKNNQDNKNGKKYYFSNNPTNNSNNNKPSYIQSQQQPAIQNTYTNTIQSVQLPLNPKLSKSNHLAQKQQSKKTHFIKKYSNSNNYSDLPFSHYHDSNSKYNMSFIKNDQQELDIRPHTIHNHYSINLQAAANGNNLQNSKNLITPLTSLNFYDSKKRVYNNSLDYRTKLNEQFQLFANKIRQEENIMRGKNQFSFVDKKFRMYKTKDKNKSHSQHISSYQQNHFNNGSKQQSAKINFKANIANKSYFYKQVKNLLVQTFKVAGKPVSIQKDKYSIQSHGLPKKKSIYSFKNRNLQNNSITLHKRAHNLLRNKVSDRYNMNMNMDNSIQVDKQFYNNNKNSFSKNPNPTRNNNNKSRQNQGIKLDFLHQTINLQRFQQKQKQSSWNSRTNNNNKNPNEKNNNNNKKTTTKGRLWIGRPPSKVIMQQQIV